MKYSLKGSSDVRSISPGSRMSFLLPPGPVLRGLGVVVVVQVDGHPLNACSDIVPAAIISIKINKKTLEIVGVRLIAKSFDPELVYIVTALASAGWR